MKRSPCRAGHRARPCSAGSLGQHHFGELLGGELGPLVGVDDLRCAPAGEDDSSPFETSSVALPRRAKPRLVIKVRHL